MDLEPIRELIAIGEQAKQRPDDHVAWTLQLGHAARTSLPALSQILEAVTNLEKLEAEWREIASLIHRADSDSTLRLERRAYNGCADAIHRLLHPEDQ